MFANTLSTQFQEWTGSGERQMLEKEIKGENYRVFEAWNLGEEAGKIILFPPRLCECGEGLE